MEEWAENPVKFTHVPKFMLHEYMFVTFLCASVLGWAPLGRSRLKFTLHLMFQPIENILEFGLVIHKRKRSRLGALLGHVEVLYPHL